MALGKSGSVSRWMSGAGPRAPASVPLFIGAHDRRPPRAECPNMNSGLLQELVCLNPFAYFFSSLLSMTFLRLCGDHNLLVALEILWLPYALGAICRLSSSVSEYPTNRNAECHPPRQYFLGNFEVAYRWPPMPIAALSIIEGRLRQYDWHSESMPRRRAPSG